MATVRWTFGARDDLRGIHDFIAKDSPRAAESVVERILTSTERLALFPESGRVVPEFPASGYRELIVGNYAFSTARTRRSFGLAPWSTDDG